MPPERPSPLRHGHPETALELVIKRHGGPLQLLKTLLEGPASDVLRLDRIDERRDIAARRHRGCEPVERRLHFGELALDGHSCGVRRVPFGRGPSEESLQHDGESIRRKELLEQRLGHRRVRTSHRDLVPVRTDLWAAAVER